MPKIEKHIELSLKRTGKDYKELHEWIEGKGTTLEEKEARHNIVNIQKLIPVVRKKFGEEGVKVFLLHIKDDYELSKVWKLYKTLTKFMFWRNP